MTVSMNSTPQAAARRLAASRRTPSLRAAACVLALAFYCGACAFKESGYGAGAQAERAAAQAAAAQAPAPDTPGMYLALIDRMQRQGLYYASLAHIDAYEKQYGATPDSTLLRADALRETGQPAASAQAYRALLSSPLAAQGYHGLGLLAGAAGDFREASHQLTQAVALAPTDAATLSDLGYALLRQGDVADARVPLMQAFELDTHTARIKSNVALLMLAQGRTKEARAWMDEQQFAPAVRAAIREDAMKIASAARAYRSDGSSSRDQSTQPLNTARREQ